MFSPKSSSATHAHILSILDWLPQAGAWLGIVQGGFNLFTRFLVYYMGLAIAPNNLPSKLAGPASSVWAT